MDQKPSNEGRAGQFQGILYSCPSFADRWLKGSPSIESRLQASRWIVVDWMLPEFCVYQFISQAFSASSCSTFVYYFIQSRSALLYQQSHRPHHHHRESIHVFRGFVCTTQWSLFSIEFNTHTTFPFHWKIDCEPHKHYDHRLSKCPISYLSLPAHISSIHDDDQFIYGSWINIHMSLVHSPYKQLDTHCRHNVAPTKAYKSWQINMELMIENRLNGGTALGIQTAKRGWTKKQEPQCTLYYVIELALTYTTGLIILIVK